MDINSRFFEIIEIICFRIISTTQSFLISLILVECLGIGGILAVPMFWITSFKSFIFIVGFQKFGTIEQQSNNYIASMSVFRIMGFLYSGTKVGELTLPLLCFNWLLELLKYIFSIK